jgi:hypothetical protein
MLKESEMKDPKIVALMGQTINGYGSKPPLTHGKRHGPTSLKYNMENE